MTHFQNWLLTEQDRILTLTLTRAEQKHTLDMQTFYELREIARGLQERPDIWAVVLEAAGEHFSRGVDVSVIGMMIGQEEPVYRENLRNAQDCLDVFEALEKPTIAKLQGYCLGGGLILALCCDFRIASENTVFGLPEVKRSIGVIMGAQRISRVAGLAAAKEMIYVGDNFNAQQAQQWNLVNQVVPHDELDTAAAALAGKFRALPPRAVGVNKRILNEGYEMSLRDSQELEIDAQFELLHSPDFQEAVASFMEKRPPRYSGK